MLTTYPTDGINVEINGLNGYAFQMAQSINQLISPDTFFSKINLGECERELKDFYNIPQNISLIFF